MADQLTTLADVTTWLRYTPDANDTALLTRLISAASAYVETWCGRSFLSASYDQFYDGTGKRLLVLNNSPVSAVASVTVNGLAIPAEPAPVPGLPQSGFRFTDTAVILDGYTFARGLANVEVVYTAGFATVPADVEQAVIDLVALRYRELDRIGMSSQAMGGETTAFTIRDMPPQVTTILSAWKRIVLMALPK